MTTAEIIKELRAMAAQCIHAPKGKHFFTETADRLEQLQQLQGRADRLKAVLQAYDAMHFGASVSALYAALDKASEP